ILLLENATNSDFQHQAFTYVDIHIGAIVIPFHAYIGFIRIVWIAFPDAVLIGIPNIGIISDYLTPPRDTEVVDGLVSLLAHDFVSPIHIWVMIGIRTISKILDFLLSPAFLLAYVS